MEAYHRSVTADVTFNPFLPAIGRVLEVLAAAGPCGTPIETTNRQLAIDAGLRSASQIPGMLRKMEALGYIERITTPRGSLIVVTDRSGMPDRSDSASGCDQRISDRPESAPLAEPAALPDRSAVAAEDRSDMPDPPHTPLYGTKHDSMQQQPRAQFVGGFGHQDPTIERLFKIGLWGEQIAAWVKQHGLTPADVERNWQKAQTRPDIDDPRRLVYACLAKNEPVYSQEELHARAESARPGAARPGSDTHRARPAYPAQDASRRAATERGGARRDAIAQPAPSITAEEARALPRRTSARLQALLEQRAHERGPGGGAC